MRYPVIFFDLDGTLTDPSEGITRSVQYALSKFEIESDPDDLRSFIGPPLHHSFMERYGFDEPTARTAIAYYREYFADRGIYENRLFSGIPELQQRLSTAGAELCLVTSKPEIFATQVLRFFDLEACFDAVVAPGLDLVHAEKRELIARAMGRYEGHTAADFVMIGDREHDIIGAAANGIDSIGVTYGAGSREELASAGATHIVDTLVDLEALLLG